MIMNEKESKGKHRKVKSFQAQLPVSFAQDALPFGLWTSKIHANYSVSGKPTYKFTEVCM